MFPKQKTKKKRMVHPASILHDRQSGTCYLCAKLNQDYRIHSYLEEHHIFSGNPGRKLSEEYGLKVHLCLHHHREGPEAVHNNYQNMRLLQQEGQQAFLAAYPDKNFRGIFGKNYLNAEERKYKTCKHVQEIGQIVVYVGPGCPRAELLMGRFTSDKRKCEECWSWESK